MGRVKNHFWDEISRVRCVECDGEGQHLVPSPDEREAWANCPHCRGEGECECSDCVDTASENAFSRMCESEPPLSADERYQAAARQKQELRR